MPSGVATVIILYDKDCVYSSVSVRYRDSAQYKLGYIKLLAHAYGECPLLFGYCPCIHVYIILMVVTHLMLKMGALRGMH